MRIDTPKYILALDAETSGLAGKSADPSQDPDNPSVFYQAIAWGLVVLDYDTFEPVDMLKLIIKPVKGVTWSDRAEKGHGMSRQWLEENGVDEEEAVVQICELIIKYWGVDAAIITLGHNVAFDIAFMRSQLARNGISIRFSNRVIDTNSLMMVLINKTGSDAMFDHFNLPARKAHDPLEDILMTIICAKEFRSVYQSAPGA